MGRLVDQGKCGARLAVRALGPGWYKLYVYGDVRTRGHRGGRSSAGPTSPCSGGTRTSRRSRPRDAPGGGDGIGDQPTRAVTGMGPERLSVQDAGEPDEAIKTA